MRMKQFLITLLACLSIGLAVTMLLYTRPSVAISQQYKTKHQADHYYAWAIAAELAISEDDYNTALHYYLKLAELSQDPMIAKRSLEIAIASDYYQPAVMAAVIWANNAPNDPAAQATCVTLLTTGGYVKKVRPYIKTILQYPSQTSLQTTSLILNQLNIQQDKQRLLNALNFYSNHTTLKNNAKLAMALLRLDAGDYKKAHDLINNVLAKKPENTSAIQLYNNLLLQQNKPQQALQFIQTRVEQYPTNYQIRLLYAYNLMSLSSLEQAKKQFDILYQDPQFKTIAALNLAKLAIAAHQFTPAIQYLKIAITSPKQRNEASYLLGNIYEIKQQIPTAINWYSSTQHGKRYFEAQLRAVQLINQQGKLNMARDHLYRIKVTTQQQLKQVYREDVDMLIDANKQLEALQILDQLLENYPNDTEFLYTRSVLAVKLNRIELMEKDIKQILLLQPENANALNTMGFGLVLHTNRYQEALEYISKALAIEPKNPAFLDSMGWLQFKLGNYRSAEHYLRKAMELSDDAEISAHLGAVLWQGGKRDDAKKHWNKALKNSQQQSVIIDIIQQHSDNNNYLCALDRCDNTESE